MGTNFSNRKEDKLLQQLRQITPKAEEYVLNIDAKTWRNTEWLKTTNLPPRYGIVTSNNAESANSMFKEARNKNWLLALDQMLHIIMVKISKLKNEYRDKRGMIYSYQQKYRDMFEKSVNYNVLPINEELQTYKVYMGVGNDYSHTTSHVIIKHVLAESGKILNYFVFTWWLINELWKGNVFGIFHTVIITVTSH